MIKRHIYRLTLVIVLAVQVFQVGHPALVHADNTYGINSVFGDTTMFDPNDVGCSNTAPAPISNKAGLGSGSNLYILGDSITARTAKKYKESFEAPSTNITTEISARVGRSWTTPGQEDTFNTGKQGTGKEAATADKDKIAAANGIVIALGTNGFGQQNNIEDIITTIRTMNPSAPVWWVNTAVVNQANVPVFNKLLDVAASAGKFSVIKWSETVDPGGDGTHNKANLIDTDGIHPNADGVTKLASLVVSTVTGGVTTQPSGGGSCCPTATTVSADTTGAENAKIIFQYLVGKGLSAEQAAGILGNMQSESHFEPRLVQYGHANSRGEISAPGQPSSLDDTPPPGADSGYGIVQFTPGTKILPAATASGKKPGDLGFQLDFLWEQFQGSEKGAFAALKAATTVQAAAVAFELKYERHAGAAQPDRATQAQTWFDKFKDLAGVTTVASGGCGNKAQANNGSFHGYFQTDAEWKNIPYASNTVGSSGCGVTSLATVISTLTGDNSITPATVVKEISDNGIAPTTVSTTAFSAIPEKHSLHTKTIFNMAQFQAGLDEIKASGGTKLMIMNVRPGYWTTVGHYFVVRGYAEDGKVQVHDVGESTARHPKTDKTYDVSFMTGSETNPINFFIISK